MSSLFLGSLLLLARRDGAISHPKYQDAISEYLAAVDDEIKEQDVREIEISV
jgi:hypothetical protein